MAANILSQLPGRGSKERSGNSSSGSGNSQEQQDINVSNPQRGSEWNNYQTKELSTSEEGDISAEEAAEAFNDEE
ncbi:MAG TPA: hypothetical protein VD794_07960 [Flavisolibacter sp.]|nr:hypothetical protein [Flavisolibacter sp.]